MKINTIRPHYYFLDTVKVNWKLPYQHLNHFERSKVKYFYWEFYNVLSYHITQVFESKTIFRPNYDHVIPKQKDTKYKIKNHVGLEFENVHLHKKDPHYNFKIEWGGKFFTNKSSRKILNDSKIWYADYLKIDDFINKWWFDHLEECLKKDLRSHPQYKIHTTISRIDIAKNHNGNMLNCIPLANGNHKEIHYYQDKNIKKKLKHPDKRKTKIDPKSYVYGLTIGKRSADSGIYFRSYDKRFDLEGLQSSLERFGTVYFVRKEWELKSRILRSWNIITPEDLRNLLNNKNQLTEVIYRIRKSADVILRKDGILYKSIHSEINKQVINKLDGYTVNEHQFDKMLKRDLNIFTNKVNSNLVQIHQYNPLKHLNGIIEKRGIHLDAKGIQLIIEKLLGKYHLNDIDHEGYEALIIDTLKHIKQDERIKKGLQEIEDKKKEIHDYTLSLIKKHKENQAAQI